MGLGVLEDKKLAHVPGRISLALPIQEHSKAFKPSVAHNFKPPGTSDIYEQDSDASEQTPGTSGLKCDWSGKQPIILVPQPSDDPNDPLVCPREQRTPILGSTGTRTLTQTVH